MAILPEPRRDCGTPSNNPPALSIRRRLIQVSAIVATLAATYPQKTRLPAEKEMADTA